MKLSKPIIGLTIALGAFTWLAVSSYTRPVNHHSSGLIKNSPDLLIAQTSEAVNPARNFEIQKLAEGVYAVVRKDLPGLMVDANNVFIINDDEVIVVDSNGAPAITKE